MENSEQSSIPNKRMIRMPVKRPRDPPDLGLMLESTETTRVTRGRPSLIVPALSTVSAFELSDCFKKCAAFELHAAAGHRRQTRNNLAFLHRH